MTVHFEAGQVLVIDDTQFRVAEHPAAPGMPYGQEGRQAVVYALTSSPSPPAAGRGEGMRSAALKVFKPRYRLPALVYLAEQLREYAGLPGLTVCARTVLTPQRHAALLKTYPDLTYAVLMPWIEGPTWMQVLIEKRALSPEVCLGLARALAGVLSGMEQRGLAHGDLSGPNVLLPELAGGSGVELVDVEQMYGPKIPRPPLLMGGSPGYAHKTAPEGLWSPEADRFAGAVLLGEMLGWCDERVQEAAWGENYFEPTEVQKDCQRYALLLRVLQERWGERVTGLFERAWQSEVLSDCATFGEWLVALPEEVPAASATVKAPRPAEPPAVDYEVAIRPLMELARRFTEQGQLAAALETYRQAQALAPAGSGFGSEVAVLVQELEARISRTGPEAPPEAAGPPGSGAAARIDALFGEGLAAYEAGEWAKARELLGEVVRREPGYREGGKFAAELLAGAEERLARPVERRRGLPTWAWLLILVSAVGLAVGLTSLLTHNVAERDRQATQQAWIQTRTASATTAAVEAIGTAIAQATVTGAAQVEATGTASAQATVAAACTAVGQTLVRSADGMVMVCVPAGEFLMGSSDADSDAWDDEKPQHTVYLDAYWIDRTEVTVGKFRRFVQATGHRSTSERLGWGWVWREGRGWEEVSGADWQHPRGPTSTAEDNHPVVQVSWYDANAYCEWAGGRLPTEAQWEKAARGADGQIYPWGNAFDGFRLNCDEDICHDGWVYTAPAGSFPAGASPYGALDMAGNVWQWVSDWYDSGYYAVSPFHNPPGPASGEYKVLRGDTWLDNFAGYMRVAHRDKADPGFRIDLIGFRCVVALVR